MPRRPHHRPETSPTSPVRRLVAGLGAIVVLTAAGCTDRTTNGSSDPSPSDGSPSRSATASSSPASSAPTTQATTATTQPTTASPSIVATTTPSATASATPSGTPSNSSSSGSSATPNAGGRGGLRGRLLTAGEVPGFNAEFRWKPGRTRNGEGGKGFGTCQRFPMTSLGALRTVVRSFEPGPRQSHDLAGELVASFPDETTARRAFEVLKSWRARCAGQLPGQRLRRVGALHDVPVRAGTGAWYLLTYGPVANDPDALWFDAQGIALVGSRIAVVKLAVAGQDYNYEPGQEPMVAAVQRAAAKLS